MVKNYAELEEIAIGGIKAKGWLRDLLKKQKSGLTGHIEVAGYPFDRIGWGRYEVDTTKLNDNPGWWAYEQTAYHLDGLTRLGGLLADKDLKARAAQSFDFVLQNVDTDGYLGPKNLKESSGWNRWPHVVFFRALLAEYEITGDKKILDAMCAHYLEGSQRFDRARDVLNTEIMLRLYLLTGNVRLLEMAKEDFAAYNAQCTDDNCARAQLSRKKAYAHGVTYNEYSKLGALFYVCTGDKSYLAPSVSAYKKIDRYQMLPDGLHCSNEFLLDNDYMQSHETCDVTDYTWALGYLLMATGNGAYADKIERCILNAGIGAIEENFKALQYLSCPNQLILDSTSNHADFLQGDKWMSYRPNPGTECCAGNVNRFFPNYCARMWMKKDDAIAAVFYGASSVTFGKGSGKVTVEEETAYPFEDEIGFTVRAGSPQAFKLLLRLPGWCKGPTVKVNGKKAEYTAKDGFAAIERVWKDGDTIKLTLPAEVEIKRYGEGLYVERGPLLFAYGMYGNRQIDESEKNQTPDFPAYNIYPDKPFNYALLPDQTPVFRRVQGGKNPFAIGETPLQIDVKVRRVPAWKVRTRTVIHPVHNLYTRPWKRETKEGKFTFTPRFPSKKVMERTELGPVETITLVPYGAAKVRVSVFPEARKTK